MSKNSILGLALSQASSVHPVKGIQEDALRIKQSCNVKKNGWIRVQTFLVGLGFVHVYWLDEFNFWLFVVLVHLKRLQFAEQIAHKIPKHKF